MLKISQWFRFVLAHATICDERRLILHPNQNKSNTNLLKINKAWQRYPYTLRILWMKMLTESGYTMWCFYAGRSSTHTSTHKFTRSILLSHIGNAVEHHKKKKEIFVTFRMKYSLIDPICLTFPGIRVLSRCCVWKYAEHRLTELRTLICNAIFFLSIRTHTHTHTRNEAVLAAATSATTDAPLRNERGRDTEPYIRPSVRCFTAR